MVQVRLPKGERSERPLRGVRGVFIHPVKDEHWEDKLHERLGLTGPDMLDKVLLRVQAQLEKLEGPSKVPIIVLDIPCKTREGACGFQVLVHLLVGREAWTLSPPSPSTSALTRLWTPRL